MPAPNRLLETTILVELLRGESVAIAWVDRVPPSTRWVSIITYFELLAGCRNRREQRRLDREMDQYRLLLVTEDISRTNLAWFRRFHLSHGVGFLDTLIAATPLQHNLILSTLNRKHFTPFPGIRLERPF
jgi:predicted nucleic acid-binding protein